METTNYRLIDGVFTADEAEKILNALFNYKIDYHKREDFSNHIRFNENIGYSKKRIQELTETKEAISRLIINSKTDQRNLVINGTITISLEENG